ncbi:PREDICTED: LOC105628591 isoform [Prunus dulcis]|uniref:PREDICTED: LOC105628591 isoform n=1 Tax=Prunus dulcis TaxID=3755 RepID=A0A5E4G0D0_PRUDU|nr:PREDICTED: LOC105628591 isoform [Prunus dulcis]
MDKEGEDADGGGIKIPNPNPNLSNGSAKGKSCKGCLYYSSTQKSKSKYPTCVGLSQTLQQVPSYIVGETELEASKADRSLTDFKYACVGYSVFLDRKDSPSDQQNKQAELPFCVGLEAMHRQLLLIKLKKMFGRFLNPEATDHHIQQEMNISTGLRGMQY